MVAHVTVPPSCCERLWMIWCVYTDCPCPACGTAVLRMSVAILCMREAEQRHCRMPLTTPNTTAPWAGLPGPQELTRLATLTSQGGPSKLLRSEHCCGDPCCSGSDNELCLILQIGVHGELSWLGCLHIQMLILACLAKQDRGVPGHHALTGPAHCPADGCPSP